MDELVAQSTVSEFQPSEQVELGRDLTLLRDQFSEHETWRQAAQNEKADFEAWTLASDDERREYSQYLIDQRSGLDAKARQLGAKTPLSPSAFFAKRRIEVRARLPWEIAAETLYQEQQAAKPKNLDEYLEQQQSALFAKVGG